MAAIAFLVVTVITIAGNAVVLSAVVRARRAPSHYPLASLAAADLLVGVSVLPIAAARELLVFKIPWVLCACWSTLDVLCCTASILSICALGWERYCGITAPLAMARRSIRAKVSAILVWPMSTVIALPTAFIPSPHYHPTETPKACTVNTNVGYVFGSVSFSFYIPASLMLYLYAYILRSLATPPSIRSHRGRTQEDAKKVTANNNGPKIPPTANPPPKTKMPGTTKVKVFLTPKRKHLAVPNDNNTTPGQGNVPSPLKASNSPGGIIPRQRRATRTIVMLMSLFLVCWTPFFIMLPVDSLCECVPDMTWQWCTWLGYANSSLNPLVYAASSPSVRRALRASLTNSSSSRNTDVVVSRRLHMNACARRV